MSNKLYVALLAIFLSSYTLAEDNFFNRVGRSYNGNGTDVPTFIPKGREFVPGKIAAKDARDLKKQMKNISKNVSNLSLDKKEEVKNKVVKLDNFINKNQVAKKTRLDTRLDNRK